MWPAVCSLEAARAVVSGGIVAVDGGGGVG